MYLFDFEYSSQDSLGHLLGKSYAIIRPHIGLALEVRGYHSCVLQSDIGQYQVAVASKVGRESAPLACAPVKATCIVANADGYGGDARCRAVDIDIHLLCFATERHALYGTLAKETECLIHIEEG